MYSRQSTGVLLDRRTLLAGAMVLTAGCLADDDNLDRRGPIALLIDGEPFDLQADRFQAEHAEDAALAFHLHEDSDRWYNEGDEPVTIAEGLDLLPGFSFEVHDDGYRLTIEDRSYDSRDEGVTIEAFVDDEPVRMESYELQDGDDLRIEVETTDGGD